MIRYQTTTDDIDRGMLLGYFNGWPDPPSPDTHLAILNGSDHVVLAMEENPRRVVGFITTLSDGVSCAYIPHLEVITDRQDRGIGSELVRRLREALREIYMIDLLCDDDVIPFYEGLGFQRGGGMAIRNYHNQSGLTG